MKLHGIAILLLAVLAIVLTATVAGSQGPACVVSVSPQELSFDAGGGSAEITVATSSPDCAFSADSGYRWITVSPRQGKGSGTVKVSVGSNASRVPWMGSVSIDGKGVRIMLYPAKITGDG